MATVQTKLLDVVELLQAPVDENSEEPEFGTSSIKDRMLQMMRSAEIGETPKNDLRSRYFEAIRFASQLPKETRLETFNSFHQECASYLIDIFYQMPLDQLNNAVKFAQTKVNVSLLNYALTVALLHREDAAEANLQLPSHLSSEPGMYLDIARIKDIATSETSKVTDKNFVELNTNFTATNLDPEHRVAYFREDIGLNLHHRHWHEVYPFMANDAIVKKDRRGELFYYMHQQIVARYNFERLSNGLPKVRPFVDFRESIEEAYFPKLDDLSQSSQFCSRPVNAVLRDLHRESFYVKLADVERWRDRIYDAIDRGYAYTIDPETKTEILKKINEETGIDELGNSVEAVQALSWNPRYYGDMHNKGHLFFSYVHDPDHRFREKGSVMSHSETALRDPIFYRWHAFIDDLFQRYKRTLPPYTLEQRQFKNIEIENVKILPEELETNDNNDDKDVHPDHKVSNVFKTYWEKDAVDVTKGILNKDLDENGKPIYAVFTHLQHEEFEYEIRVKNSGSKTVIGTVRIFMAPHYDESGVQMSFNGQRKMFIELDKFTAQLKAGVVTTINRKSADSTVTIPFEKTFMTITDVRKLVEDPQLNEALNKAANGYCGCGWPHHLLIGKGTTGKGLLCDLFVMITDYEVDKVDESPLHQKCCDKSSLSYCGVRNNKYPDKKPMGFPFDRDIPNPNATVNDFMTENQQNYEKNDSLRNNEKKPVRLSNMMVVPVRVRHKAGKRRSGKSLQDTGYPGIAK